jgi:class 3 adenylate cyclase
MTAESGNSVVQPVNKTTTRAEEFEAVEAQLLDNLDNSILSWFKKRNGDTLKGALAFVPWVLQQAYFEGGLEDGQIVIHKGSGAVVFSDASGFTALTERLAKKSNGAELLSQCLTSFFTPLIDIINAYRGDVIKFSGDALTIYFQAVDDTKSPKYNNVVPPHGTWGLPDLGPMATSVLRACACCIEIHKRLHMFETGVDGVRLCLHIGIGCGDVRILQVGGVVPPETHVPRCEYIIAGPPLEQISIAEPLAKNGETCLSPQAWVHVKDCVVEGPPLEERPDFHLLLRMDESKYTFPTIKHAAIDNDNRLAFQFKESHLPVIRRYIASSVFKQIEQGTLTYVNEMRQVSVIFICGSGLDIMSEKGPGIAQELMKSVQNCCYQHEGTLNKFLIDDKGMLFLLVFGLPPLVHTDDPTRAILACFDMVQVFKRLNLIGKFGVTSGRSYCGVFGSARRMEYTVLGDCVNLSARLMANAPDNGILTDEMTKNRATTEIIFNALAPIKVKGKAATINVFAPIKKDASLKIGLTIDRKIRYPWNSSASGGGTSAISSKAAVIGLLNIKTWSGITQGTNLLGTNFEKALHHDQALDLEAVAKAPPGSPFADGGVVILDGPTAMGKVELAEHLVTFAAAKFRMFPVFGTMGPRPGDSNRLGTELLRSLLGIFRVARNTNETLPDDDFKALEQLIPSRFQQYLPLLREGLRSTGQDMPKEKTAEFLSVALDILIELLSGFSQHSAVLISMQFEYGSSLFPKRNDDATIFWSVVNRLYDGFIKKQTANSKPRVLLLLVRDAPPDSPAAMAAEKKHSRIHLEGLTEENIAEYMSTYLELPDADLIPSPLRIFVWKVTLGNPLYIRETIDQMREHYIQVNYHANNTVRNVEVQDIEKINVSLWGHTSMVGGTVCLLESLDPLEAAVLKMSTCFDGPFTLADLAASTCSRWADSTYFDFLRLFQAIKKLHQQEIVDVVDAPQDDLRGTAGGNTQKYFQTRNVLIKSVGGAMVLEAQKKSVKRQALIDRALSRELPARMHVLEMKRLAQHIPWYYEQAFRRM